MALRLVPDFMSPNFLRVSAGLTTPVYGLTQYGNFGRYIETTCQYGHSLLGK
jgi:hypothetical protein